MKRAGHLTLCLIATLALVFLIVGSVSAQDSVPTADPMVGDYLSYFNIPLVGGVSSTIQNKLPAYINGATPARKSAAILPLFQREKSPMRSSTRINAGSKST
jgi:hypothetical protein